MDKTTKEMYFEATKAYEVARQNLFAAEEVLRGFDAKKEVKTSEVMASPEYALCTNEKARVDVIKKGLRELTDEAGKAKSNAELALVALKCATHWEEFYRVTYMAENGCGCGK